MEAPNPAGQQAAQQAVPFEGEEPIHIGDGEENEMFLAAQPVAPNPAPVQAVVAGLSGRGCESNSRGG